MSACRLMIEMDAEQSSFANVRTAFGIWNDVLYQLSDSSHQLRALGEQRQADAMRSDAESMVRRARLHLRYITQREVAARDQQQQQQADAIAAALESAPSQSGGR